MNKTSIYGENQYTYDSVNRLIQESFSPQKTELWNEKDKSIIPDTYVIHYFYDGAGNRTGMESAGMIRQYTYDNCNRLLMETTGDTEKTFTYDICGNLVDDGNQMYTYDELNRLTMVTTAAGYVQENRYDAEGLRHEVEENGKLVQFIYNRNCEVITEESEETGLLRYTISVGSISSVQIVRNLEPITIMCQITLEVLRMY